MSAFYNVDQPPFNMGSAARAIAAANNGLLFNIGDMSTMFQDAAGTIPVTAVEQPVGLILDKSRGMMLGPELVTNGDFSNGTAGWALGTGWSVTTGSATFTAAGAGRLQQNNILTIGRMYRIQFNTTITSQYIGLLSESLVPQTIISQSGYKVLYLTATSPTFSIYAGANGNVLIDNISVREIYGNHATQPITASRPTLSARKNVLLATETLATQSVTTIAAQYTLSFTGTGSVTLSGSATGTLTGTGAANRVSLTVTPTAGTLTLTVSGSVTKAQLELGTASGPYQRVNTSTDYDTDERYFPKYLRFDGVDDYLNLPYMGLYAGGSASVVVAKNEPSSLSANQTILAEGNTTTATPVYSILRYLTVGVGGSSVADSAVTNFSFSTPFIASACSVESAIDSGNYYTFYRNSVGVGGTPKSTVVTTLNNLVLGAVNRGGTLQLYSLMNLYGLIITKSALTDAQRIKCERFLARKAGAML